MPKPGKYNNKPSWKNQYNDDFRAGGDTRRVSFKQNRHFKKDWSEAARSHIQDEDIDMGGSMANGGRAFHRSFKGRRRGGRSDSPAPNYQRNRQLLINPMGWYRVTLPYGNKYEKSFLLKTLMDLIAPLTLWPISWTTNGTLATFYIDDYKLAEKLMDLSRQFQMPDGFKLIIKVNSGIPQFDLNASLKEKIKETMAKRYNQATKALDLTKFHADPGLQDVFCALFKPTILLTIIDIIAENIPELEAINFNDNKIANLGCLKKLDAKMPKLKILHFGNNKIRELQMLDCFFCLPIVDILLDGNPLCLKYKDQEVYIGEVRKRFPKVIKLDGVDLPPPIGFDIIEEIPLPISQQTFLCSPEGEGMVRQFLQAYFSIYDTENRQPLIQAYHESAVFSMTMSYPYPNRDKNSSWLNWYTSDNRNLCRLTDPERRSKLLKQGQVGVVSFLQEMPKTKHDIHSFTVDLPLFTPQMICLTVTGMFKELNSGHKVPPVRYFFRTMAIVPAGSGFCIVNETLHITNATEAQIKNAFKVVIPDVAAIAAPPAVAPLDNTTKQRMVQAMSEQSQMNIEWSEKCLAETNWEFARAVSAFGEANAQGKIPPEAFVK